MVYWRIYALFEPVQQRNTFDSYSFTKFPKICFKNNHFHWVNSTLNHIEVYIFISISHQAWHFNLIKSNDNGAIRQSSGSKVFRTTNTSKYQQPYLIKIKGFFEGFVTVTHTNWFLSKIYYKSLYEMTLFKFSGIIRLNISTWQVNISVVCQIWLTPTLNNIMAYDLFPSEIEVSINLHLIDASNPFYRQKILTKTLNFAY